MFGSSRMSTHVTTLRLLVSACAISALLGIGMATFVSKAYSQSTRPLPNLRLSSEEQEYLKAKAKLTVVGDPEWPPYDYIDANGNHAGMAADILRVLSHRLKIEIKLLPTMSWVESVAIAKAGACDLVTPLNETPDRLKFLNFTEPYITSPVVVVGRKDEIVPSQLEDMRGLDIAVIQNFWIEKVLIRDYPLINHIRVQTTEDALNKVIKNYAHATLMSQIEAAHLVRKNKSLEIVGVTEYVNKLRLGVRKNDPILLSIMQKAINSMSPIEKENILNKWAFVEDEPDFNLSEMLPLIGVILGLLIVFYWYHKFR